MSTHHKSASDGDWTCSDSKCGNVNFARRSSCNRCGKDKLPSDAKSKKQGIEIGKVAAEKSHGLFSADDWQCTKCGNVNWARRSTCNMCNAPRVGDLEERTGYGGGFNERMGVEYIEREDSDDEWDEYGNKKKKFRGAEPEVKAAKPSSQQEESEEDDDCDVSKYDLWGDDDGEESSKEEVPNNGNTNSIKKKPSEGDSSSSRSSCSSSRSSSSSSKSSSRSRSSSPERNSSERSRSGEKSSLKRRYSSSSRSRSRSGERKYTRKIKL